MPQVFQSVVGAIVRWAVNLLLGLILAYLVQWKLLTAEQVKAIVESNEVTALILFLTAALGTLLWSLYVKFRARYKLKVALDLPAGASPAAVKQAVKDAPLTEIIAPASEKPADRRAPDAYYRALLFFLLPCTLLLSSCTMSDYASCEQRRARAAHLRTAADLIDCPEPRLLPQSGFAK